MTATWQLDDPRVVDGVKTAMLPGDTRASFESPCMVHKGPDPEDPERLELWLPHTPAAEFIAGVDQWALTYLTSNAQRFFNLPLSPVQVAKQYQSALATLDGEHPLLRARFSVNAPCEQLDLPNGRPVSWPGLMVWPLFDIKGLWFTEDACGLTVEVLQLEYDFRMYACYT